MTPEEQRLAIATACGWREAFPQHGGPHELTKRGGILLPYRWVQEGTGKKAIELPDYLNDLNAMQEAEKVLKGNFSLIYQFAVELNTILRREIPSEEWWKMGDFEHYAQFAMATAPQRAEAVLRTLNLWKD